MNRFLLGGVAALSLTILAMMPARSMPTEVPQDIIFVFDSSGSLGSSGYAQQIAYMKNIVQTYGDDALHPTRFGLVEFSTGAIEHYSFFDDQDPTQILNYLDTLN